MVSHPPCSVTDVLARYASVSVSVLCLYLCMSVYMYCVFNKMNQPPAGKQPKITYVSTMQTFST
jgi:hypothetical protein